MVANSSRAVVEHSATCSDVQNSGLIVRILATKSFLTHHVETSLFQVSKGSLFALCYEAARVDSVIISTTDFPPHCNGLAHCPKPNAIFLHVFTEVHRAIP